MKIRQERERRFSYDRYIDRIETHIRLMKTKNMKAEDILKELQTDFRKHFMVTNATYEKHLSSKMMNMIDRFTNKLSSQQALQLVNKALEYNSEVSSFRKVQNAFTVIEYYYSAESFDNFKTNWKAMMRPED